MAKGKTIRQAALCLLGAGMLIYSNAVLAGDFLVQEAADQYSKEHYQEALVLLEKAEKREEKPPARLKGLTLFHLFKYQEALPILEEALSGNPDDTQVIEALVSIYLAEHRMEKAKQLAEMLLRLNPSDAKALELGAKVHVTAGDTEKALRLYRKAVSIAPASDAAAELARLLAGQGKNREAQQVIEQALAASPDPFTEARLSALTRSIEEIQRPVTMTLGYRYEYDNNAILEPNAPGVISGHDRRSDQRHVLTADILAHSPEWKDFQAFGEAHISSTWYHHLSELDSLVQNYVAGIGWSGDSFGLRLPFDYTHATVDSDSYLDQYALAPGAYFRIFSATLYAYTRFSLEDYHNQDVTPDDDRDSRSGTLGLLTLVPLPEKLGFFRLIAQGSRVKADGRNWDRDQVMVYGNLTLDPLSWLELNAGFQLDQLYFDYLNHVYLKTRDDTAINLFAGAAIALPANLTFRLQYSYVDWDSNIPLYKYYRNVVSAGLSWKY